MGLKEQMEKHEKKDQLLIKFYNEEDRGIGIKIEGTVTREQMMGAIVSLTDTYSKNEEISVKDTLRMVGLNLAISSLANDLHEDLRNIIGKLFKNINKSEDKQ